LDCIPWESAVTRTHYENFKETLRTAFTYGAKFNGVAVASRLLANQAARLFFVHR